MNESLIDILLTICVLLCSEASQSLLKEVYLERIKSCDERIDTQIILEAIDQVWVADVLRNNVAWLALDFLLLPNDFNPTAAG